MIAKLHKKGRSHVGLGRYLLHDKERASTSERVAWAEVRNLATRNPHTACRVMAATALDAPRLKSEAGIKNTGRKSADSVLHLTLSYHPSESKDLTKEEMVRAANGVIRALGAEDRQALIVCHDDEDHVHVHVALCRTSPVDGRMLSSSKEKLNLSRWAERYERDRGRIFCDNRVVNNAARDRGEYTRGQADKPRHIYELEAANAHKPEAERIRVEQKRLDLALGRKTRELRTRHTRETAEIAERFKQTRAETRAETKREAMRARDRVRAGFRPAWEQRFHEHQAELRAFEQREKQLLGRVGNALRAIDFSAILSGRDRRSAMRETYNAISSSGGRLEGFRRAQAAKDRELERRQKAEELQAIQAVRAAGARRLNEQRALFKAERSSLIFKHDMERAGNRTEWRKRSDDRRAAFENNRLHGKAMGAERHQEPDGKQTIERDRDVDKMIRDFQKIQEELRHERERDGLDNEQER